MKLGRRSAVKAGVGAGLALLGAPAVGRAQAALKLPLATLDERLSKTKGVACDFLTPRNS